MSELTAIISVHAQFPKNVAPNTELNLDPTNWEWKQSLAIPVSRLNDLQLSLKPYKWIRYATGIVIGARGELCTECDLSNPVPIDYNSGLPAVSMDLYYHTTDQEKRHMFPLDPNLADTRTMTSSRTSTARDNFHGDVEGRDGSRCVVTGDPGDVCDAVHLLPHSKGDMYIERFCTHRRRGSSGDDNIVRVIDDVRNGLFLDTALHRVFGKHLAILKTPNFAMDTTDVDSNADRAQERYTSHLFDRSFERAAGPSGSAIRIPSDMSSWPPAVLFDGVYASAVLHHFGFAPRHISEKWENMFYPGVPTKAAHTDDKRRCDQADADEENSNRQKVAQQRRYGSRRAHDAIDPHDMVMMHRFSAMEPEKVRAYLEGCEEMAAARTRQGLEESVNSWRESAGLAPLTAIDMTSGSCATHGPAAAC